MNLCRLQGQDCFAGVKRDSEDEYTTGRYVPTHNIRRCAIVPLCHVTCLACWGTCMVGVFMPTDQRPLMVGIDATVSGADAWQAVLGIADLCWFPRLGQWRDVL